MKNAVSAFLAFSTATGLAKRDRAAVLVFSRVVGYTLPLPSSPVVSPNAFYTDTLTTQVHAAVSEINESIVVDVPFLLENIRKVWLVRYDLVYRPTAANVQLVVAAVLTQDDNAFSTDLLADAVELSKDGLLNRLTSVCITALNITVPPVEITTGENIPVLS